MAFKLALGCRISGYGTLKRSCCSSGCFRCEIPQSVSIANGSAVSSGGCNFPDIDGTYDVSLFDNPGGDSWGSIDGSGACDWGYYIVEPPQPSPCIDMYVTVAFRLRRPGALSFGSDGRLFAQIHYAYALNNIQALFNYELSLPFVDYICPSGSVQIPLTSGSGFYRLVGSGPPLPVVDIPDIYLNFP